MCSLIARPHSREKKKVQTSWSEVRRVFGSLRVIHSGGSVEYVRVCPYHCACTDGAHREMGFPPSRSARSWSTHGAPGKGRAPLFISRRGQTFRGLNLMPPHIISLVGKGAVNVKDDAGTPFAPLRRPIIYVYFLLFDVSSNRAGVEILSF